MRTSLDLWTDVSKTGVDIRVTDGRSGVLVEQVRVELDSLAAGERLVDEIKTAMTTAARHVIESAAGATG